MLIYDHPHSPTYHPRSMMKGLVTLVLALLAYASATSACERRRVAFVHRGIPAAYPRKARLSLALTQGEAIDPPKRRAYKLAVKLGHHVVLASHMPQSTQKAEMAVYGGSLEYSRRAVDYLKYVYNYDKMTVLKSVDDLIKSKRLTRFTRDFRSPLSRPSKMWEQINKAAKRSLVIEVSIQSQKAADTLDALVAQLREKNVVVRPLAEVLADEPFSDDTLEPSQSLEELDAGQIPTVLILIDFVPSDRLNAVLVESGLFSGFAVDTHQMRHEKKVLSALAAGLVPVLTYRVPLDRTSPSRLVEIAHDTNKHFEAIFKLKMQYVLLESNIPNSKEVEDALRGAGYTPLQVSGNLAVSADEEKRLLSVPRPPGKVVTVTINLKKYNIKRILDMLYATVKPVILDKPIKCAALPQEKFEKPKSPPSKARSTKGSTKRSSSRAKKDSSPAPQSMRVRDLPYALRSVPKKPSDSPGKTVDPSSGSPPAPRPRAASGSTKKAMNVSLHYALFMNQQ